MASSIIKKAQDVLSHYQFIFVTQDYREFICVGGVAFGGHKIKQRELLPTTLFAH